MAKWWRRDGKTDATTDEGKPPEEASGEAPDRPSRLGVRGWFGVVRRTVSGFMDDNLVDWAAALTYYGVLSLFPALIMAVSLVGLLGTSGKRALADNVRQLAPGQFRDSMIGILDSLQGTAPTAGVMASAGLLLALWSASRYVGALIRALNAVYAMPEGRPLWKLAPLRLLLTLAMIVLLASSALAITFTGRLAEQTGRLLGLGSAFVTAWGVLKWPVLLTIVIVAIATLYWAGPNVRQPGWRWVTPGCVLAVLVWVAASAGFAVYVANFGSYNRTYGALATAVIFLVWMWFSNVAILVGAEFDAELARGRAIEAGGDGDGEPFAEPRDTSKINDRDDLSERDRDNAPDRDQAPDQEKDVDRSKAPDPAK